MDGLYLRTMLRFSLSQLRSDPVRRCHTHMACNLVNQGIDAKRIKHVVHCINHASTLYEEKDEHLSIVTSLSTPESDSKNISMIYKFLCKNSCPGGMNRRPTELVFTLENDTKIILACSKLLLRVCCCPKRDKEKKRPS